MSRLQRELPPLLDLDARLLDGLAWVRRDQPMPVRVLEDGVDRDPGSVDGARGELLLRPLGVLFPSGITEMIQGAAASECCTMNNSPGPTA